MRGWWSGEERPWFSSWFSALNINSAQTAAGVERELSLSIILQFPVELLSCDIPWRRRRMQSHCFAFNYFLLAHSCLNNVLLVSAMLQNEYVQNARNTSPPFQTSSPFGDPSALSTGPCAIQDDLISCLFYTEYQYCVCVSYNLSVSPGFFNTGTHWSVWYASYLLHSFCKQ